MTQATDSEWRGLMADLLGVAGDWCEFVMPDGFVASQKTAERI